MGSERSPFTNQEDREAIDVLMSDYLDPIPPAIYFNRAGFYGYKLYLNEWFSGSEEVAQLDNKIKNKRAAYEKLY